jgi:hypothetical protein
MVSPDKKGPEGYAADRNYLTEAVDYCRKFGIEFWGINENPQQRDWTGSPKQYAHVYIDDTAFGCPLRDALHTDLKVVDWFVVGPAVMEMIESRVK